jgi:hypothetical protein
VGYTITLPNLCRRKSLKVVPKHVKGEGRRFFFRTNLKWSKIMELLTDKLEPILDSSSLMRIIGALAHLCYEKGEHVATNWQDEALAQRWDKAGAYLNKVAQNACLFDLP